MRTPQSLALIVGNGLTIDFVSQHVAAGLDTWHPGQPLRWNIHSPEDESTKLIDRPDFDVLRRGVLAVPVEAPPLSDFERLRRGFDLCMPAGADRTPYLEQACRYLAESYSYFHRMFDPYLSDSWRWTEWLRHHSAVLHFAVSFNYDVVIERTLSKAGISHGRIGIADEPGLPLLKPHGSIDFGTSAVPNAPGILVMRSDFPQRRLTCEEMTRYRTECNLVLPLRSSHLREHQAVLPGFERWKVEARSFSCVVIAGVSYGEEDRPEVDTLLDGLTRGTDLIVVNPDPPSSLLDAARSRQLQVRCFTETPPTLA